MKCFPRRFGFTKAPKVKIPFRNGRRKSPSTKQFPILASIAQDNFKLAKRFFLSLRSFAFMDPIGPRAELFLAAQDEIATLLPRFIAMAPISNAKNRGPTKIDRLPPPGISKASFRNRAGWARRRFPENHWPASDREVKSVRAFCRTARLRRGHSWYAGIQRGSKEDVHVLDAQRTWLFPFAVHNSPQGTFHNGRLPMRLRMLRRNS